MSNPGKVHLNWGVPIVTVLHVRGEVTAVLHFWRFQQNTQHCSRDIQHRFRVSPPLHGEGVCIVGGWTPREGGGGACVWRGGGGGGAVKDNTSVVWVWVRRL